MLSSTYPVTEKPLQQQYTISFQAKDERESVGPDKQDTNPILVIEDVGETVQLSREVMEANPVMSLLPSGKGEFSSRSLVGYPVFSELANVSTTNA